MISDYPSFKIWTMQVLLHVSLYETSAVKWPWKQTLETMDKT